MMALSVIKQSLSADMKVNQITKHFFNFMQVTLVIFPTLDKLKIFSLFFLLNLG